MENFFNYLMSNAWDNSIFHRNAKVASGGIGVLQGGAVTVSANGTINDVAVAPTGSKVPNEFLAVNSNIVGTIAMAQSGGDINSATNQFFFNTTNNAASLNSQKFTVFGKVADAASMAALQALAQTSTKDVTGGAFAAARQRCQTCHHQLRRHSTVTDAVINAAHHRHQRRSVPQLFPVG